MSSASTVTYTSVYTDSEPRRVFWGADEELSDRGGPEEDHADYPVDGGDDDDEPSDDDDTNDEDKEPFEDEDDDEEEEHLALADSFDVPVVDPVPSAGDTKAFETDESAPTPRSPQTKVPFAQTRLRRARKTVRLELHMSPSMEACIAEYAAALAPPSPPPSPLSPWSPSLSQIPLPPPPSSLHLPPHVPTSLLLPSSPLPVLLFIPPPVDRKEDIPEAELPPRKRLCLTAPILRYEVGESSTAAPRPTGGHRADYRQTQLFQRVDGLVEGGQFHYETARLLDQEAHASREAWAHSVGLSSAVHYELQAYRTHTQMQDYRITSSESLMTTLIAHVSSLQGQLSAALGQIQALQARDQTHADDPEGAAAATPMTVVAVEQLIEARVSAALANHETLQNGTNGHGDGSNNSETRIRGTVRTPMESVFHISNCAVENQVKFATCTFLGNALTWWNSHMKTVTQDVAYAMDWKALKKMMTVKYYPRGEIKKLEIKLWNLKVKGTDVASYTMRFQELALICGRMFHKESEEVEKYVGGLRDMIRGNVMSYQPKTMEKAIEFANDQMDQKVLTITENSSRVKARRGS
ncbi:reverse transcriptase domain-containing protein [Tanacetum coccineum]|uniref:Reverse transcriptase domain-containing protein n=1 Tax=Tanacetum coccineum TaxID=301880 RepID=A0ABQ5H9D3_9ASTR